MAKRLELVVLSGEMKDRRLAIGEKGLRIGRSSSNDFSIRDEELSRNHCVVECEGESGLRIIDLASANGTFVNGEQLGAEPKILAKGDVIEIGSSRIKVVGDGPVDLGLNTSVASRDGINQAEEKVIASRSRVKAFLWGLVAIIMIGAIATVLLIPTSSEVATTSIASGKGASKLTSLSYEKVEADQSRIFRYEMKIDEEGVLSVKYDDVPEANRHVDKKAKLDERARLRILDILDTKGWNELESAYVGPRASDENALKSWRVRVVRDGSISDILVENTIEPDAFKAVREALETFSRNELGIWAIQYSREQLIVLSEKSVKVANAKWEERDVEYGNLSAAIDAYREAIFYLETVNPKPDSYAQIKESLDLANEELNSRYRDQRFKADKAINLADWETARDELRILCDMVPNKRDSRHEEATAKLVDVEKRLKKSRKGGR